MAICAKTDLFEGSIIRATRRLDELMGELATAAHVIGDVDLEAKFRGQRKHHPARHHVRRQPVHLSRSTGCVTGGVAGMPCMQHKGRPIPGAYLVKHTERSVEGIYHCLPEVLQHAFGKLLLVLHVLST